MQHQASSENDKVISFINNNSFGWKADTCKMTKGHPERGAHCDKQESLSLAQISS